MKKFIKIFVFLIVFCFLLVCAVCGYFIYEGYEMYQNAIKEASMEQRINKIRSKERIPCFK